MNGMTRQDARRRFFRFLRVAGLALLLAGGGSGAGLGGDANVNSAADAGPDTLRQFIVTDERNNATIRIKVNEIKLGNKINLSSVNSFLTISGNNGTPISLFNLSSIDNLVGETSLRSLWEKARKSIVDGVTVDFGTTIEPVVTAAKGSISTAYLGSLPKIGRTPSIIGSSDPLNLLSWQEDDPKNGFPQNLAIENIHFNNYILNNINTATMTSQHAMIGPSDVFDNTAQLNQTLKRIAGNWFDGNSISMTVSVNSMVPVLFTLRGGNANIATTTVPGTNGTNFTIDQVDGNLFDDVRVTVSNNLNGAGWFGTSFGVFTPNSINGQEINFDHSINEITGNIFKSDADPKASLNSTYTIDVTNKIQGSGIVGVRVDIDYKTSNRGNGLHSYGKGEIGTISGNLFDGLAVRAGTQINGAGLVGVYVAASPGSNQTAIAKIGTIRGNIFNNNTIWAGASGIKGGGLIAVQGNRSDGVGDTSVSDTAFGAQAEIGEVEGNIFYHNTIESYGTLLGGGIIGVNSDNHDAILKNVSNNLFEDITVTTFGTSSDIQGGGILAVNSNSESDAHISNLNNAQFNIFNDITISSGRDIFGGGLIGANAGRDDPSSTVIVAATAKIGTAIGNLFSDVNVTAANDLKGGGVIGSHSVTSMEFTGSSSNNYNFFNDVHVTVGTTGSAKDLEGGGMIGASTEGGDATMIDIGANYFNRNNTVTVGNNLTGGGFIGAKAGDNHSATIKNSLLGYFLGGKVEVTGSIAGGGVIGVATDGDGGATIGIVVSDNGSIDNGSIRSNSFQNNNINVDGSIAGGGVIGARGGTNAQVANLSNNSFINNNVVNKNNNNSNAVSGGGIIGATVTGNAGTASITDVTDNTFWENRISIETDIQGGGIIGAVTEGGTASIDNLQDNTFGYETSFNVITAGAFIQGGGMVGALATGAGDAIINNLGGNIRNIFSGDGSTVNVQAETSITGGGVIGAMTNGAGDATIGAITNNLFEGMVIAATAGPIQGGGLVGAVTEDGTASIDNLQDNKFGYETSFNVIKAGASIQGGGMVGALATGNGTATINNFGGNIFSGNGTAENVKANAITGGGVIGAVTNGTGDATIGAITNSLFEGMVIAAAATTDSIQGGGIIGAVTEDGTASINNLQDNTFGYETSFNVITAGDSIQGGGMVGALATGDGAATIRNLGGDIGTIFSGDGATANVQARTSITGGGIIGAMTNGAGDATIGTITNSLFEGMVITATTGSIQGGGIIGAAATSTGQASIDTISFITFDFNKVTAQTDIDGGILAAVTANTGTSSSLNNVNHVEFMGNGITAGNGSIKGGLVYASGLNAPSTIQNSTFAYNSFSATDNNANNQRVFGAVTIDTANTTTHTANTISGNATHVLNLSASNDYSVLFAYNFTTDEYAQSVYKKEDYGYANNATVQGGPNEQAVSIYFGPTASAANSAGDAELNITAGKGSTVKLLDPIRVEQDTNKHFNMTINTFATGTLPMSFGGYFLWGGDNVISLKNGGSDQAASDNVITFEYGDSYLMENFKLRSDRDVVSSYKDPAENENVVDGIGIRKYRINGAGEYVYYWDFDSNNGTKLTSGGTPISGEQYWDPGTTGGAFDVILKADATLYLPVQEDYDPKKVPEIIANSFSVDGRGRIDLDYEGYFFPTSTTLTSGNTVLRMEETEIISPTTLDTVDLASGKLMFGAYDVEYDLVWDGYNEWEGMLDNQQYAKLRDFEGDSLNPDARRRNVILMLGRRTYNPQRGGDDTVPPPLRIVTTNVGPRETLARTREWFRDLWNCAPVLDECGNPVEEVHRPNRPCWCEQCRRITVWGRANVNYAGEDGDLGSLSIVNPGLAVGFDRASPQDNWLAGVSVGQSFPFYESPLISIKGYDITALAYGAMKLPHNLELSGYAGFGHTWFNQKRQVPYTSTGNLYHRLNSRHGAWSLLAGAELLQRHDIDNRRSWFPFVEYGFRELFNRGYTENATGDSAADDFRLRIDGYNQSFHQIRLGVGLDYLTDRGVKLRGDLFYRARFGDLGGETEGAFAGNNFGNKHRINGIAMARHAVGVDFGAGIPLFIGNRDASLDFTGRAALSLGKRAWELGGMVTLSIAFGN